MAEIEFKTQEEVERWLMGRSREDAIVLAARAALRVAPLLFWQNLQRLFWPIVKRTSVNKESRVWRATVLLPCLHGLAWSWRSVILPPLNNQSHAASSAAFRADAASQAAFHVAFDAAHAAYLAVYTYALTVTANDAYVTAARTVEHAVAAIQKAFGEDVSVSSNTYSVYDATNAFWTAVSTDANLLRLDMLPAILAYKPLWHQSVPTWALQWHNRFATDLHNAGDNWDIWAAWYYARFNGGNAFGLNDAAAEQVETGIMLLPEEVWKQGPKTVNPAIKRLIDQARAGEVVLDEDDLPPESAIPPQDQRGASFGGEPDEPIGLAPMEAPDRLRATSERQEDYDDIREKAEAIKAEGVNRVSHLMGPLDRLLSLSANLSGVRAQPFWSRVNTLRIKQNGHIAAIEVEKNTGEKDERRLDAVVADLLADLVETINAFHLGDPKLVEFDAARPGPKDIAQIRAELAPILPALSKVADNAEIVAADASEVLKESIEDATRTGESLAERQSVEASSRTLRNFVTTLLSRAYRPIKKLGGAAKGEAGFAWKEFRGGAYKEVGAATIRAVGSYIASNKDAMIAYVTQAFHNMPSLIQIIEAIAKFFGGL